MLSTLAAVAPGTELRDAIERIIRGRTGALVVLGHDETVEQIATGGFPLDIEFSATRLRELAKMDGAVVLDSGLTRIVRAATQLLPDASIDTNEAGTRHRTAEDRVQRGLAAQDGAAEGFGDLRHHRIAEGLDDQTRRRHPFATAKRNARASQPGGKPCIQP